MEWGYVSLDKVGGVDVKHIDCPNFEVRWWLSVSFVQVLSSVKLHIILQIQRSMSL
jgi:hypothetical protein